MPADNVKIQAEVSPWDDGDYIVAVRPDFAKPWQAVPIGPLVTRGEGATIAEWLEKAWPQLARLATNLAAMEAPPCPPTTSPS